MPLTAVFLPSTTFSLSYFSQVPRLPPLPRALTDAASPAAASWSDPVARWARWVHEVSRLPGVGGGSGGGSAGAWLKFIGATGDPVTSTFF